MTVWESIDYVSQWAKDKREGLRLSQEEVAEAATRLWQAAGGNRTLKQQNIQQLEKREHKGVPVWFQHVRQAMDQIEEDQKPQHAVALTKAPVLPDLPLIVADDIEMIAEVDIRYAMGVGNFITENPETGQVPFNRNFRRSLTNAPVEKLFIARGDGDSMVPTLINDDMVLIDTTQNRIGQSDRIWAVAVGEAGMIKRVRVLSKDQYELHSDNPMIRPQPVSREDLTVVGRVIWVGRRI